MDGMVTLDRFLRRLRPAGTPGAAAPAGVPLDRTARLAAELGPVLALLDEVEQEASRIRVDGRAAARARRVAGEAAARSVVAKATAAEAAVRANAAAAELASADNEVEEELAAARQAAAEIRGRAEERMPDLADRAVEGLLETLAGLGR